MINKTTVKIGLLPIGSYVIPKGYGYFEGNSPIEDDDFRCKPLHTKLSISSVSLYVFALATVISYCCVVKTAGNLSLIQLFDIAKTISLDSFTGEQWQIATVLFAISTMFLLLNCLPMIGLGLDQMIKVINDKYRTFCDTTIGKVIAAIIWFVAFSFIVFFIAWLCL